MLTNERLLNEFLEGIVRFIYRTASQSIDVVREAAADENPNRLIDRLIELEGAVVDRIFSYIDGGGAPTHWPNIKLVNADTNETLSEDLASELARVEGEYIEKQDEVQ